MAPASVYSPDSSESALFELPFALAPRTPTCTCTTCMVCSLLTSRFASQVRRLTPGAPRAYLQPRWLPRRPRDGRAPWRQRGGQGRWRRCGVGCGRHRERHASVSARHGVLGAAAAAHHTCQRTCDRRHCDGGPAGARSREDSWCQTPRRQQRRDGWRPSVTR